MAQPAITTVYQGENVTSQQKFYNTSGNLIDPDILPTFAIYDANNAIVFTGEASKTTTGIFSATYFVEMDAILGFWKFVWTASIGGAPVLNNIEVFEVLVAQDKPVTQQLVVQDQWMRQIKSVIAFPGIEQNIFLNDEKIREFCVWPAMYEYFKKFPIKQRIQDPINQTYIKVFPDNLTFGVTDLRVVGKIDGSGTTSSTFWDIVRFNAFSNSFYYRNPGNYGSKYNFEGLKQTGMMQKHVADSISNMATFKYYVNYEERQLEVYASTPGQVFIEWAKYSLDFNAIKWQRIQEVIQLSQSYLLFYIADSGSLIRDSNQNKELNIDAIRERAQSLRDAVLTNYWYMIPDVILLRAT